MKLKTNWKEVFAWFILFTIMLVSFLILIVIGPFILQISQTNPILGLISFVIVMFIMITIMNTKVVR
jgi:uncharacterized Tic20 family protein